MIFKLVYGNHQNNGIGIHDTLQLIQGGLQDLGHDAHLEKNLCPGYTNIIVECFSHDFIARYKEISKTPGTRHIIVATEFLTGENFNQFSSVSSNASKTFLNTGTHYDQNEYWMKRYVTFCEAVKYASEVWHLNEEQVRLFQKIVPCPVKYLPHGFVEQLDNSVPYKQYQRDIDILFSGCLTPYRKNVLSKLHEKGLIIKFLPADTQDYIRKSWVKRSKIVLNIMQNENWKFSSNSRFYYHLMNGPLMISEDCPQKCDLSKYITEITQAELIDELSNLISSLQIEKIFNSQRDRFRDNKPNQFFFEKILSS